MERYVSVTELAKVLGISTVALRKRIVKGQIKAFKVGNTYVIPRRYVDEIQGKTLSVAKKKMIDDAVKRSWFGIVLRPPAPLKDSR